MRDLPKRIEGCSPERRKLIERLLKKKGLHVPLGQLVPESEGPLSDKHTGVLADASGSSKPENQRVRGQSSVHQKRFSEKRKDEMSRFYNSISEQLELSMFGKSSYFLNLGYVANENPQYSRIELPRHFLDKNSTQLVLETIGDIDVSGSRVLDVGCGRGGTIFIMNKYFDIRMTVGVDLSLAAISFCNEHHNYDNAWFINADAENLPFADGSFNFAINIESSNSYPNIFSFYNEVSRILKPGGYFLYADFFPDAGRVAASMQFLQDLNFIMERDQDITANVLASCDEIAARRLEALGKNNNDEVMTNFLGTPGSVAYEGMKSGKSTFRIFRLRKT